MKWMLKQVTIWWNELSPQLCVDMADVWNTVKLEVVNNDMNKELKTMQTDKETVQMGF